MKNNNYSVLGKILAILNNDFPPYVSKTFSDNVMKNIHMNTDSHNFNYKNFINIAASVFFCCNNSLWINKFSTNRKQYCCPRKYSKRERFDQTCR